MFHAIAFQRNQPAAAVLQPLTPVPDQMFPQNQSNQFIAPANFQLLAGAALGVNISEARLNTPSLRDVALPDIYPLNVGATPLDFAQIDYKYGYGPTIPKNDPIEVDTSNPSVGNDQQYCVLWFGDGMVNSPAGKRYSIHATSAIVVGNKVWGSGAITFDQVLPYGTFAVVGFQAIGANLVAARLVFVGGGWRPGCLAVTSQAVRPNPVFRAGVLGEWGRFESNAIPTVELFGNGAPTTQEYIFDLVKIA